MKKEEHLVRPSGKGWLKIVTQSIQTIGTVAGTLLASPVKLPGKLLRVAQYLALAAGIVKATERSTQDE